MTGVVKWWSDDKGYGFITSDDDGRDLFVHHSEIAGTDSKGLTEGARVRYSMEEGEKGPKAIGVVEVEARGDAVSVQVLIAKIRQALRVRSFGSKAALRAYVAPPEAVGDNRAPFHRAFNDAVTSLEVEETITGWPTPSELVEWHRKQVSRGAVLRAIEEFDRNGRDETLAHHGFGRALDYVVVYEGKEYDSKALYAIAYGLDHPNDPPLRDRRGFSGGFALARKLEREGFKIRKLRAQADSALAREGARAWIVRAGQHGENEDLAQQENVVLIGWSELGEIGPGTTRSQLKGLIRATGESREASVNAQASSIYRFINEMQEGDLVVLPLRRERGKASVGVIDGPFVYRPEGAFKDRDAHYQRPVNWLSWGLPYEVFDQDLREAFGAQGTVSEIRRENPVERLIETTEVAAARARSRGEESQALKPEEPEPEPEAEPVPPGDEPGDRAPYVEPPLEEVAAAIRAGGLSISERMLRRYHVALRTRGFVILAGISGGGKTWLAEKYATASRAELLVAPVAPNWTTNEDLLGYLNPIDGHYCHTPFSHFLIRADREYAKATAAGEQARPYHLVLDEMNLARVEHYFAKFLSAMEGRERNGTWPIELSPHLTVQLTPNLHVVGTVNVDETTHAFADKVYDRAQLIELEVPREALGQRADGKKHGAAIMRIWDLIHPVAPFGFRVFDEVDAYVAGATSHGATWQEALDDQLLQKVLPKIKGTDPKIGTALQDLADATRDEFPLSHAKVEGMLTDFTVHGFVSYF